MSLSYPSPLANKHDRTARTPSATLGSITFVLPETFVTRGQLQRGVEGERRVCRSLPDGDNPERPRIATRCWSCSANWDGTRQD
jgi:hypothetical protein